MKTRIQNENTLITFKNREEFLELMKTFEDFGWVSLGMNPPSDCGEWYNQHSTIYVRMRNKFSYGDVTNIYANRPGAKLITMEEFREIQHLSLNPKVGDVYYSLSFNPDVVCDNVWDDTECDKLKLEFNNVFRSKIDAGAAMHEIQMKRRIRNDEIQ